MPLHVWLPEAHASAPQPRLRGALRACHQDGHLRPRARARPVARPARRGSGARVVALGVSSGVLGVVCAIAQHDLKRLLAYHSIENIGIILIGLGLARARARAGPCGLGGAGPRRGPACTSGTTPPSSRCCSSARLGDPRHRHTREIDALGGLLGRMPLHRRWVSSSGASRSAVCRRSTVSSASWPISLALWRATTPSGGARMHPRRHRRAGARAHRRARGRMLREGLLGRLPRDAAGAACDTRRRRPGPVHALFDGSPRDLLRRDRSLAERRDRRQPARGRSPPRNTCRVGRRCRHRRAPAPCRSSCSPSSPRPASPPWR